MKGWHSSESTGQAIPTLHGQKLISPPMEKVASWIRGACLEANSVGGDGTGLTGLDVCGMDLASLRLAARQSAVELATLYTSQYRHVSFGEAKSYETTSKSLSSNELSKAQTGSTRLGSATDLSRGPIVMGGHQPDLFHCGVWFKNFLLSDISKATGAVAIHFLVDNDLCRTTGVHLPVWIEESLQSRRWQDQTILYDSPREPVPWENCFLRDPSLWRSFPDQIRKNMPLMHGEPLVDRLWQHSESEAKAGTPLGELLSRARHRLEEELGLKTLEVPLSHLVSTPEFARFSLHLLNDLPRLHGIYNSELNQYRESHRIRNHAQPLPNLDRAGSWFEAPWWYYPARSQVRFPLWVCHSGDDLILSNRQGWEIRITYPAHSDSAVEQWLAVLSDGGCLRPRALLTTMYARLICSDVFVHGMGGARYDQLTDRIIARYFGVHPPPVVLATATLHLPLENLTDELLEPMDDKIAGLQQHLRAAHSNPEHALRLGESEMPIHLQHELQQLRADRQALLSNIPPKGEKWEWHTKMKRINERLCELAKPSLDKIQSRLDRCHSIQRQQAAVLSREYSFCLFPIETIVDNLRAI